MMVTSDEINMDKHGSEMRFHDGERKLRIKSAVLNPTPNGFEVLGFNKVLGEILVRKGENIPNKLLVTRTGENGGGLLYVADITDEVLERLEGN